MRFYSFTNFMLSSIQQAIQPAHCISEMFVKYRDHNYLAQTRTLYDWAETHKTMICLNGGNFADVQQVYDRLVELAPALQLPFAKFHEDEQSLGGLMTSCAIIVPEPIYQLSAAFRQSEQELVVRSLEHGLQLQAQELAVLLNQYSLAR